MTFETVTVGNTGNWTSCVYVVHGGDGLYKIGWTEQPIERRMAALQTGCPRPLELVMVLSTPFRETERFLHKHFAAQREQGEWFRLTDDDLERLKSCDPQGDPRVGIPMLARVIVKAKLPEQTGYRHTVNLLRIVKYVPQRAEL